jgi:hypothetical protein
MALLCMHVQGKTEKWQGLFNEWQQHHYRQNGDDIGSMTTIWSGRTE